MTPKTINEALAKCSDCAGSMGHWFTVNNDRLPFQTIEAHHWMDCPTCNGTGYACGVAPTEVERHLFAIVEATRALGRLAPDQGVVIIRAAEWAIVAANTSQKTEFAGRMARLEALALSTRKETT